MFSQRFVELYDFYSDRSPTLKANAVVKKQLRDIMLDIVFYKTDTTVLEKVETYAQTCREIFPVGATPQMLSNAGQNKPKSDTELRKEFQTRCKAHIRDLEYYYDAFSPFMMATTCEMMELEKAKKISDEERQEFTNMVAETTQPYKSHLYHMDRHYMERLST